jgi:glycosyltransferase involved in cell wall biosynthesis
MKKILCVCYDFPPVGASGVQRNTFFAKYLPLYGYDPVVLTLAVKYQKQYRKAYDESLLRFLQDSTVYRTGTMEPVWLYSFLERAHLLRVLQYFLFPDIHVLWCINSIIKSLAIIKKHDCRAIFTSSYPWSTLITGYVLQKITNLPWVADFRDPWTTDPLFTFFPTVLHYKFACLIKRFLLRSCSHITVVTKQMQVMLEEKYPSVKGRVSTITNGFEGEPLSPVQGRSGKFIILYTGVFEIKLNIPDMPALLQALVHYQPNAKGAYYFRTPQRLLESVARLFASYPDMRKDLKIQLVGAIPDVYKRLSEELGIAEYVEFTGYVPYDKVNGYITDATVLFLFIQFHENGLRSHIVTGKLFEYLRSGKPVLAFAPDGDAKDMLQRAGVGFVCHPENNEQIDATVLDLYRRWKNSTLDIRPDADYIKQFNRKALTGRLAGVFDTVTG